MSILIDKLVDDDFSSQHNIGNGWYIAKPISFKSLKDIIKRIKDAFRVLKGTSFAVHYKIDE